METEENRSPSVESWNDFAGDYLKAEFIKEFPASLPVIDMIGANIEGKYQLIAEVEYNGRTWKLNLNKGNQAALRKNKITAPNMAIGKVLIVDKSQARNPQTKEIVDTIVITDVE